MNTVSEKDEQPCTIADVICWAVILEIDGGQDEGVHRHIIGVFTDYDKAEKFQELKHKEYYRPRKLDREVVIEEHRLNPPCI